MRVLFKFSLRMLVILSLLGHGLFVQAEGDHDEARRLLESGDIMSLETILEKIRPQYPGEIIDVEIEKEAGLVVYELEIVGDDGIVHEIYIDARTGDILRSKRDD